MDKKNVITTVVFLLPVAVIGYLIVSSPSVQTKAPVPAVAAQRAEESNKQRIAALEADRARVAARLEQVTNMTQQQWDEEGVEWAKQGRQRAPNLEAARGWNRNRVAEIDRALTRLKASN